MRHFELDELCDKCKYNYDVWCNSNKCNDCGLNREVYHNGEKYYNCLCLQIDPRKAECPYFAPKE